MNAKLQTRRDHIEELNQVRSLLFKLQAVFNLPKRLRVAIEQGALEVAVNSYADAAPLLQRYGHKVGGEARVRLHVCKCAVECCSAVRCAGAEGS